MRILHPSSSTPWYEDLDTGVLSSGFSKFFTDKVQFVKETMDTGLRTVAGFPSYLIREVAPNISSSPPETGRIRKSGLPSVLSRLPSLIISVLHNLSTDVAITSRGDVLTPDRRRFDERLNF